MVHRVRRNSPDQEHGVLLTHAERHSDQAAVAPQQVLVERRVVLLGSGHDVGLVVQHPLSERKANGRGVLFLPDQPGQPASVGRPTVVVAFDGGQDRVLGQGPVKPPVDERLEGVELDGSERSCFVGHRQAQSTRVRDVRSSQILRSLAAVADQV